MNKGKMCVAKPDDGTDGVDIYTIDTLGFVETPTKTAYALQDMLNKYFTPAGKASSFRLCTSDEPFFLAELTHNQKQRTRKSVKTNPGKNAGMRDLNPDSNANEREMLHQIFVLFATFFTICVLVATLFYKVPVIGFDVMLTCRGPLVLEGNLGRSVPEHLIPALKQIVVMLVK